MYLSSTHIIILVLVLLFVILIVALLVCRCGDGDVVKFNSKEPYDLVVGAVFKNEGHILDEWVRHYKHHGVDHIYLIDDGSTDNFMSALQPHIQSGFVTLFTNTLKIDTYPRQKYVYEKYFRNVLSTANLWMIVDLDEFVYSSESVNIKKVLKNVFDSDETVSQVQMNWMMFGSSGYIQQPKNVVQSFLYRQASVSTTTKSAFRSTDLIEFDVHSHNVRGKTTLTGRLIVNHYAIQSWEFFKAVKMSRGDADNYIQTTNVKRDENYFKEYDFKDVVDKQLYDQNKSLWT
jgi:hypothetical protein